MSDHDSGNLPDVDDDAVRAATGRGWEEWVALIDAWPGSSDGHTAVATYLREQHDVEGWWAQGITVGWERLTGRRLKYQRADGTFTASRSRTLPIDAETLRASLIDDEKRDAFLGLTGTALVSRPESKSPRIRIGSSSVLFASTPTTGGGVRLAVEHEKLRTPDEVEKWHAFWSEWLDRLAQEGA